MTCWYALPRRLRGKSPWGRADRLRPWCGRPGRQGISAGKAEETLLWYPPRPTKGRPAVIHARRVLVVGCGKVEQDPDRQREQLRVAAGVAAAQARKVKAGSVLAVLPAFTGLVPNEVAESVSEGLLLGNYLFARYKKAKKDEETAPQVARFLLHRGGLPAAGIREGTARGARAATAVCAARDMANEPANFWTAAQFAEYGRKLAHETGPQVHGPGQAAMKRLGMGGILAVNQGSAQPAGPGHPGIPCRPKDCPTLLLVGKGLDLRLRGRQFEAGGRDGRHEI